MRLLCAHQMRNLNHACIGMNEIESCKRSTDMEAIYIDTFRIESLFVTCSSWIWIGFEDSKMFSRDML